MSFLATVASAVAVWRSRRGAWPGYWRSARLSHHRPYRGAIFAQPSLTGARPMCRNIRTLANFEPPATEDELRASALQFVRKLSGMNAPSRANAAAFERAVDEVTAAARTLVASLEVKAPPKHREVEARKARERSRARFGRPSEPPPRGTAAV